MPSLPLTFEKCTSFLDNLEMIEYTPKIRIEALLKTDKLLLKWDENNYQHTNSQQNYENEVEQIKAYKAKNKINHSAVIYKTPKHGWGRPFIYKSLGFTAFRKHIRNTLLGDYYVDLDLKNAQPALMQNICRNHNIKCPRIDYYCENRDDILKEVCERYNVKRSCAKKLFLRLFFKGTEKGWLESNHITPPTQPYLFIDAIKTELDTIANKLKQHNPILYETARKLKENKNEKNYIGSFFALYLQEAEKRVMSFAMKWLVDNTSIFKKKGVDGLVGAYEYDGLKLLKYNVEKYGGTEKLIADFEAVILQEFNYDLKWEVKEIEDKYDITAEMMEIENEGVDDVAVDDVVLGDDVLELHNELEYLDLHNHRAIVELVEKIKPKHFIYHNEKWFGWNENKWEQDVSPIKNCIYYDATKYLDDKLKALTAKYTDQTTDNYKKIYLPNVGILDCVERLIKKLNTETEVNFIISTAKTLLKDDKIKFDDNRNLLGFDNGVFDIIANTFRPYKYDDYCTMSCGYNFEDLREGHCLRDLTDEDVARFKAVNDNFLQIHPDETIRNLNLKIFASGLSGNCIEKFFVFNGGGGNGKGLSNEFMCFSLGDYFYDADISLLQDNYKESGGSPNPALAGIDKKRYVVLKEPLSGKKLLNDEINRLTGGGVLKARRCYSNNTDVELYNTTVLECNTRPKLASPPTNADARRYVDILFGSTFTDKAELVDETNRVFLANATYKSTEWKTQHRVYFMNILITHLQQLHENNYSFSKFIPVSVQLRSQEYLQNCLEIHTLFVKLFEPTGDANEFVNIKSISSAIKASDEYEQLSKKERRGFTDDVVKTFFTTNAIYKNNFKEVHHYYEGGVRKTIRSVLLGWKSISFEDSDSDD